MTYEWPEITAQTPIEEVKRIHERIWDFVINHGHKPARAPYPVGCALCQYATVKLLEAGFSINMIWKHLCIACPSVVGRQGNKSCLGGLYDEWRHNQHDYILAKKIRDIEFVDEETIAERINSLKETLFKELQLKNL